MKAQCPHCGKEIGISILTDNNNQSIRWEVLPMETGLAVTLIPKEGESVFACIPPFAMSALYTIPNNASQFKCPDQYFTASTIWKPSEEEKYRKEFIKLVEEKKIFCVGKIDKDLKVKINSEGKQWIEEMNKKYTW